MSAQELKSFTFGDGLKVDYYLDEEGFPYNESNGERIYLALPLPHLEITDKTAIALLKAYSPDEGSAIDKAPPTNYINLSGATKSYTCKSAADLTNDKIFYTPFFKWNTSDAAAIFRTRDIKSTGGKKISVAYAAYSLYEGVWHHTMLKTGFDFSVGFKFQNFPSAQPYGQFYFNRHDTVTALKYTVTSSATW